MSVDFLKAPFPQLNHLLASIAPEKKIEKEIIDLAIGQPRHAPPDLAAQILCEHIARGELVHYPPTHGLEILRNNIAGWLHRRFDVNADPEHHILPVCGTREALFLIATCIKMHTSKNDPIILVPDPGYQSYPAAARGAGATPIFLPARAQTHFLPDLETLDQKTLNRVLAFYLCTPANPQGAIADKAYLQHCAALAQKYNFTLITDECYTEIYHDHAPLSALNVGDENFKNIISFHSLSKRSNVPGLRSGFCAGDLEIIHAFRMMRELGGVAMPLPTQYASAALWADDKHVEHNRALYQQKFDLAEKVLGHHCGFYRPQGGFFLWLDVGDGVAMTKKLWKQGGVRVLPGQYLSQHKEGEKYIRIALVAPIEQIEIALLRIKHLLEPSHV